MRKRKALTREEAPNSSPLERYLGRKRGADGKLEPKKKRRKVKTVSASVFGKTIYETEQMIATRDWSACAARHLVALHEIMHHKTYGISADMTSGERHVAGIRAAVFVKERFGGEISEAIAYFRWLWTREIGREKWRRDNQTGGKVIGFGLAFSGSMLNEYRIEQVRTRHIVK